MNIYHIHVYIKISPRKHDKHHSWANMFTEHDVDQNWNTYDRLGPREGGREWRVRAVCLHSASLNKDDVQELSTPIN